MRAYSMDLRERVLRDSDAGMNAAAVAVKYHVSASWVRRLKHRRRETGEVAPRRSRPSPSAWSKLTYLYWRPSRSQSASAMSTPACTLKTSVPASPLSRTDIRRCRAFM